MVESFSKQKCCTFSDSTFSVLPAISNSSHTTTIKAMNSLSVVHTMKFIAVVSTLCDWTGCHTLQNKACETWYGKAVHFVNVLVCSKNTGKIKNHLWAVHTYWLLLTGARADLPLIWGFALVEVENKEGLKSCSVALCESKQNIFGFWIIAWKKRWLKERLHSQCKVLHSAVSLLVTDRRSAHRPRWVKSKSPGCVGLKMRCGQLRSDGGLPASGSRKRQHHRPTKSWSKVKGPKAI